MSSIASKNLYELLGNDPELDPDREPEPPTKVIDKTGPRVGKRNGDGVAPSRENVQTAAGGRGGRQQNQPRVDQVAPLNNRDDGLRADRHAHRLREPRDREGRGDYRGDGRGRGRGRGRGGRGGAPRDDRHSHTGIGEQDKQAAHGWGGETGTAEWADERAGEAIARAEAKNDAGLSGDANAGDPAFANGPGADGEVVGDPEPEDNTKSYDQYLAEQAEKRLALGDKVSVRKANEGSTQKFPEGKAFERDPDAENFFIGSGGKTRKVKDAQDKKERVNLDQQYYAPPDSGDRGGRGRGRGGRGAPRGGGRGRGRADFRGGASRGDRSDRGDRADRGGRGGFNAIDQSSFPALGAS